MRKIMGILAVIAVLAFVSCVIETMEPSPNPPPKKQPPATHRPSTPPGHQPSHHPAPPPATHQPAPPPASPQPAQPPGQSGKCSVRVNLGNQTVMCEPGPAACNGARNQCKKQYPNARSLECMPGCK